ncbi:MAG: tRNA/rRNA methyltransferase [Bacteroidales bacterium]
MNNLERSEIYFIIYKPAVSGNIGASARALKTMGFSKLRLIDPSNHLSDEAKMMAHGSHDVLENCKVFKSYEEAVADLDFIVCTTAKKKSAKVDYIPSPQLSGFLSDKKNIAEKIGVVFGSEESGLPNSIIQHANVGVTIPMATDYPSLNLSQAVMIFAYELSSVKNISPTIQGQVQRDSTWRKLQDRTSIILEETGIKQGTPLYHRIMERMSLMQASDARLVHSITSKIQELLKRVKK